MNARDVQHLIDSRAQESLYMDFKRGEALGRQNDRRTELIKDVTGLANADGGKLLYGITEERVDGIPVATGLAPVVDNSLDKDWLSTTIRDNTSPRFHDFDIEEIAVEGGRVIVIDVRAAGTAHQNLGDLRYYQRAGVSTAPIQDFRIRDLMARGTRPVAEIDVQTQAVQQLQDLHRYLLRVSIANVGNVSLEKWWLNVDVPSRAFRDSRFGGVGMMHMHGLYSHMVTRARDPGGAEIVRVSFGDPFPDGTRFLLHPGQRQDYDPSGGRFPEFCVEVDPDIFAELRRLERPIAWTLYLNNAQPIQGEVSFDEWCRF
ncbi:helix-turn-helix domain-containing protein [Variovorax sp. Varisp41]|uniref:AlbA family DNA-binding domain-containing protein n=1 Tax=Variovorax sp. Varisp41 TaxID=3243033 RepID=UPI0039B63FDB